MSNTVIVSLQCRHIYDIQGVPTWWQWCKETFGPANNSRYGVPATEHYWRLLPNSYAMWFANPAHATLFALRWS